MLYDNDFLLKLDKVKNKTIYARITSLTFQENPIEYIEGRVTQGSINIDGVSAVRRTCSLTLVAEEFDYNDYYWGLNTKFKLEIGVENTINTAYPDIIWFKQGIFLITSFNTSRSTNNFSISIQGKDKMCLLNGEVGGSLESSVDFGTIEEEDENGVWTIKQIPLFDIIKNAVHVYGGEPYHNIIINDLDMYGLELLEYRYDTPLYLYRLDGDVVYKNITLDGHKKCNVYDNDGNYIKTILFNELTTDDLEPLIDKLIGSTGLGRKIRVFDSNGNLEDGFFYIAKVEYGQTAGYRKRDLTFAGDLIANVGESLTSILDKIKNMLVEFEYFYDLDGRFVFQKKQSFISTFWSEDTNREEEEAAKGLALSSTNSYVFGGGELITAFNNNPNLLNLRNDYSVWGERTSVSGAKIPVHMRYAIDRKPKKYVSITVPNDHPGIVAYNKKYNTTLTGQTGKTYISDDIYDSSNSSIIKCDWREIIYQMALDYYKYNHLDDFELLIAAANPIDYPRGRTDYEQYYTDLQGFWRELYNPFAGEGLGELEKSLTEINTTIDKLIIDIDGNQSSWIGYRKQLLKLENATEDVAEDISEEVKREVLAYGAPVDTFLDENGQNITNPQKIKEKLKNLLDTISNKLFDSQSAQSKLEVQINNIKESKGQFYEDGNYKCWNTNVYNNPELLNFWFDFLDTSGTIAQYGVKTIGSRPKAINDTQVKSIYYRETPSVVFKDPEEDISIDLNSGYRYIQTARFDEMFTISAQGKSAKERIDELLYQHGYCVESATITTIPIYYLEPNTRIYLYDKETNLQGDYIVNKLTIPLAYNGTMQISATKAAQDIL